MFTRFSDLVPKLRREDEAKCEGALIDLDSRDFKNRGRGGSETRPEVIFPISDEDHMRVAFSPELENAAWRDLALSGKRELFKAKHYN